jgi:hypothetical protein
MSKAIQGLAMIGGAVALGATAFLLASTGVGFAALPYLIGAAFSIGTGGIAMEAGAIAQALSTNRGANITIRQPAAYRQIVYGTQRVGGTMIYLSTTGSKHDQVNYIIPIAGHEIDSIVNVYLDGRQVFFVGSGVGNSTRNGVNFGGNADSANHTGPGGALYNFGGLVYFEACYGDQTNQPNTTPGGGFNTGLQANDPTWAPTAQGLPYVGGCAYLYFKYVYDAVQFPQPPEVRITVRGKNNIFDPRTGTRGYTANWALVNADVITDSVFGLGDDTVNQANLIAAANICDEQVSLAAGGTESRYSCHYHYDTSTGPGAALAQMMPAAAGRYCRSGGEWYLFPASWQGPSFSFDENSLAGPFTWKPYRNLRDLCNRMTGTYTAANYPYNATTENGSDLFDANGFYDGTIQNNFGYAFQATSIPYYAQDQLHGYPANQLLNDDSGVAGDWSSTETYGMDDVIIYNGVIFRSIADDNRNHIPVGTTRETGEVVNDLYWTFGTVLLQRDIALPAVLSISQSQRVLKINLLRNRQQGSGTFLMFPAAFRMMQIDVMNFSMAKMGWTEKALEIAKIGLGVAPGSNGVPCPMVKVDVQETAASVYEWDISEEIGIYLNEIAPALPYTPAPPTNMELTSSAATAIVGADGIVRPRAQISWNEPLDGLAVQIQVRYQAVGTTAWIDAPAVPIVSTSTLVDGVVAGAAYNFRIRTVRANGATSAWVAVNNYTVSLVLSVLSNLGVGIGSLTGEAFSSGGAAIVCGPFTARVGNTSVAVLPTRYTITGLSQAQQYDVYYVDPTFAGGAVTPIATQDAADYLDKVGYFLIDTIVTPTQSSGGGGTVMTRYAPGVAHDIGSRTTVNEEAAFDGNSSSSADISATSVTTGDIGTADIVENTTSGDCLYQSFANVTLTAAGTLTVVASLSIGSSGTGSAEIIGSISGTPTSMFSGSATTAKATYTMPVPSGTSLLDVTVEGTAGASDAGDGTTATTTLSIFEIYVTP